MTPPTIIFVGADKGGVGKTMLTRALLDYLGSRKIPVRVFDTESPSGDLIRFFDEAEVIDITKVQDQMKVFDGASAEAMTVVDIRAGLLAPTIRALDQAQLLADVRAGAMKMVLLHVLGPTVSSISEIAQAGRQIGAPPENFNHLIVKNHINDTQFFDWDQGVQSTILAKFADITISVPHLAEISCEMLQKRGGSFLSFIEDSAVSRTARGLVYDWLKNVWAEFQRVDVVGLGTEKEQAMQNAFIKPAMTGAKVPDPVTKKPLDAGGEYKPLNAYWTRRIDAGDVIEVTPPGVTSAPARSSGISPGPSTEPPSPATK